jgi:ribonucleoside-diphosphate reductase alpha chain
MSARKVIETKGSLRALTEVPEKIRRRFPCALEIAPKYHLGMQAAFQNHVDAAVSKTVNLPPEASQAMVKDIFSLARELRLKGITVYRYGSRSGQTLSLVDENTRPDCRECAV